MDRERFRELVAAAIDALPDEFRERLENVDVVMADWPSRSQLAGTGLKGNQTLLGLYQGVPLTKRGRYGMVTPDKITVFRKTIEARCRGDETEITAEIGRVVRHEIAHHFGTGEARIRQIENGEG